MVLIWLLTACIACYFFAEKYINPNALSVVSHKSKKVQFKGSCTVSEKDRINIFFWPGRAQKNSFQKMFLAFVDSRFNLYTDIIHY